MCNKKDCKNKNKFHCVFCTWNDDLEKYNKMFDGYDPKNKCECEENVN